MRTLTHRSGWAAAFGLSATLFAIAALGEPASSAWFGLKTPSGLGDPHRPVVDVSKLSVPQASVPAGEEKFTDLQASRMYRDVETIVNFSKQSHARGDKVWGRVTGFPAAKATVEWSGQQLKDAGLKDVQIQQYAAAADAPMWWAKTWEVRLLSDAAYGAGTKDVVLESSVPTSGSMIDGGVLTAPLVYAGPISDPVKLTDSELKGKVAVQHIKPQYGPFGERPRTVERAQELAKHGAVAVINVVEQTGNMHVRDFGNCGVPCFNVGTSDGSFLEGAIARATAAGKGPQLRLQLKMTAERLMGLTGHNAFGVVPGKSDENIVVNAHADGWYDAAGDNADGLAVLFALARHFARPENQPQRTLVFVASGGHHSTGLNGPANFVKMNAALTAKTVMVLNLEHVAQLAIDPADVEGRAGRAGNEFRC